MCTCDKNTKREESCGLTSAKVRRHVYDGDLDVRVKCRVRLKKPGDAELKDFVSVDLAANVGTIVSALGANFVEIEVLGEEPTGKSCQAIGCFRRFDDRFDEMFLFKKTFNLCSNLLLHIKS